jgi:glycosyltransferase involved in cell wall biosynthesis
LKNVEAVFQAFQLIRRDLSTARLYLAGRDFGPGEAAERWATARGLTESVTFLGEIPANAIGAFFGKLDLLIHPSLEESFGMSVLEAMASGVPVVGGDRSGAIPWLLGSGRDGALVDIRSPVAIASAALSVLTDEGVWSGYAERAWRRAVEDFDMSTVLERYLREYEAAIRSSARREVNQ